MRYLAVMAAVLLPAPALAEYRLDLTETGMRDYYCTITVALTNGGAEALTEVNAYFLSFVGDRQVGRSKGASFRDVPAGGTAEAVFETPNAPCEDVTAYHMVIGACRIGQGFEDKAVCAGRMDLEAPFASVDTLN
ncbi:hypothetical protein AADZ90_013585 [Aestuariibius sp. 2305UL40-4]|uniref:hypothetical protein n=1 Tax=Aestuariibius violaceus TaxID=3234132 RepID=UPI00345ECAA2